MALTLQPDAASHLLMLQQARAHAGATWHAIKDTAAAYLKAQVDLVFTARLAHDAGLVVTELDTAWLRTTPEEAVIQARVDTLDEETRSEKLNSEVTKILDALRASGYEPHLRPEDITTGGGGGIPVWIPEGEEGLTDN